VKVIDDFIVDTAMTQATGLFVVYIIDSAGAAEVTDDDIGRYMMAAEAFDVSEIKDVVIAHFCVDSRGAALADGGPIFTTHIIGAAGERKNCDEGQKQCQIARSCHGVKFKAGRGKKSIGFVGGNFR